MVGLGNVDNTSDQNKPISNATAAALADKDVSASLSNNVLTISQGGVALSPLDFSSLATDIKVDSLSIETGTEQNDLPNDGKNYLVLTKTDGGRVYVNVDTFLADVKLTGMGLIGNTIQASVSDGVTTEHVSLDLSTLLDEKAPLASPTFTGTVSGIDKNMITGLETALNGKQDTITPTTDLSIQKLTVNKGIEWSDSEISYLTCVTFSGTTMTVDAKGKGYVPLYVQQDSGTYSTINLTNMENGAQVIVALYGTASHTSPSISSELVIQVDELGNPNPVPKTLKKNFTSNLTWTNTTHVLLAFFKMGDCIYLTGQELS